MLPRESFRSASDGTPFEPGYLLPRGEGRVEILCAVRREAIAASLLRELDGNMEAAPRAEIELWLEQRGFELSTVSVQLR